MKEFLNRNAYSDTRNTSVSSNYLSFAIRAKKAIKISEIIIPASCDSSLGLYPSNVLNFKIWEQKSDGTFQLKYSKSRSFYGETSISVSSNYSPNVGQEPILDANKLYIFHVSGVSVFKVATRTSSATYDSEDLEIVSNTEGNRAIIFNETNSTYTYADRNEIVAMSFKYEITNSNPTITLDSPVNNHILYENDSMVIAGNADDTNKGDVVTVRYQVNALTPVAILPFVADGAAKPFSRELTFRAGKLYDGATLIAENLADGVPHTLKVFAGDDKGGQSPIVERTFYVVPNRTPLLTVEPPVINGVIDSDEIEFTGAFSDPDHNQATVSYRINGGNSVQVAQGTSGLFDFKVRFGQLQVGLNSIVVEVVDSYGAKVSRTIKLQKDEVAVAQLKSTARYKIKPPLGTATGVVLWVQRDEGLSLDAKISMTQVGEAEHFVAMTKSNTAPMANQPGVVEDQFQYENATAANNIILQLDMEKSSVAADEKIHLITGVVD